MEAKILDHIMNSQGDIFYEDSEIIRNMIKEKDYGALKFIIEKGSIDCDTVICRVLRMKQIDFIGEFINFCGKDFLILYFNDCYDPKHSILTKNKNLFDEYLNKIPEGQTKSILDLTFDEIIDKKLIKTLNRMINQKLKPTNEDTVMKLKEITL